MTKIELLKFAIDKKKIKIEVVSEMLETYSRELEFLSKDLEGDEERQARADKKALKQVPKEGR